MTQKQLAIAVKFVRLLKARDPAISPLLSEGVVYQNLGVELNGRAGVLEHLLGEVSGRLYREAEWQAPRVHNDAVLIAAHMPSGSSFDDKILLLRFRDNRVIAIQEQFLLPMKSSAETPLKIGADLKEMVNSALETRNPMLLAHLDEGGQPVVSFRGSVHVFDDDQLALWVRNAQGRFIRAITENPRVALIYRNENRRATFQFQGRARIAEGETERRIIFDALPKVERDHDFAQLGAAIIIEVDRIEGYGGVVAGGVVGAVNMRRTRTPSEDV